MRRGRGREICRRPGAAHACKTVLGAEHAICWSMCLCVWHDVAGRGRGWMAACSPAFGCNYRLSRPLNEGARSCCSCLRASPRTIVTSESTRATSNLLCDLSLT